MRSDSHLAFVRDCLQNDLTPKGLQVNLKCQAMLAASTDIRTRFQATSRQVETSFKHHLEDHYVQVDKLELEQPKEERHTISYSGD